MWTADQRSKSLGQEPPATEEREHAALVRAAEGRGLAAWQKFGVFTPVKVDVPPKEVVNSRGAPTWKVANGRTNVKARPLAKGRQEADLRHGPAETSGFASLHPSHLPAISLSALKK